MKSGAFGCITSNMKQVVSKLCNICPLCLRQQDFKKGRGYTSFPGDPRLLQLLSVDNPVFFYTSCDILPPFWISYAQNCRKGKYPIYVLNTVCLGTGLVSLITIEDGSKENIITGLNVLALKFRLPNTILSDAGSQFVSISKNLNLYQALISFGVKFITVNEGAQHRNFCELRFQTVKRILKSLRDDMNQSIYQQPDTLTSLQSKLLLVENIVSFKPILVTTNESTIKLTNSKQLSTPLLTPSQMKDFIIQTVQPLNEFDELAIINLNINAAAQRSAFKEELLNYL